MRLHFSSCFTAALALVLAAGLAPAQDQEKLPPSAKVVRLEAMPAGVDFGTPFDYRQLLVTGHLATGEKVDVTRLVKIDAPSCLQVSPAGLIRPKGDGTGTIRVGLGEQSLTIPVTVKGQKDRYDVSFVRDVMPMMSRLGCNAGTCHGAQAGKNGFKLSLRGYDPLYDHNALTDDLEGRRFNRAAPEASLMLLKPAGAVPHTGGAMMKPGDPSYELLKLWIAQGAKLDLKSPRVKSIEVHPKAGVVPLPGMKQQTVVMATYTDGTVRDVTAEAFVEPSNIELASVDKQGLATTLRRGELALMARFEGSYAASPLVIMGDRSGFAWKPNEEFNWIDGLVYDKLKSVKLLPSEVCNDGDFIRRLYLDLTGLPPSSDQVRAFIADQRPTRQKRDELVDRLIGSPEFVEHWTNKWADLLQVNSKFLGTQGATALRQYIRKALADNVPYDKFVHAILTGSGSTLDHPEAAYWKILRDPTEAMENTTHLFLAVRFNCNKCHDHPFERWTQDQYYHLASYFSQVGRAEDPRFKGQKIGGTNVEGAKPLVEVISDTRAGDVKHDRTGKLVKPEFPYPIQGLAPATASRREQLAHWMTSKENPYFARGYANRVWSYLLGVGLIEPVDDVRAGNPPTNPKLLDRLTAEFVKSNFNTRELIRVICKSRTYQHSVVTNKWNADDEINYSHALARRLPAEVLFDSIHRATGSISRLPGLPPGSSAAQLLDSSVPLPGEFLKVFGKPARESACECERAQGLSMEPVLNLINGPVLAEALKDTNSRLNKLALSGMSDVELIEEVYLSCIARRPTKAEIELGLEAFKDPAVDHARLVAEYEKRKAALDAADKAFMAKMPAWEKGLNTAPVWTPLDVQTAVSTGGAKLVKQPDGSILATGPIPEKDEYTVTVTTQLKGITALRLEVLPDPSLGAQGPGRAPNGNFVLNSFGVTASPADNPTAKPQALALHRAQATFSQGSYPVQNAIDKKPGSGWAIAPQFGQPQSAAFELKQARTDANGTKLTFRLVMNFGTKHVIGKFRLSATTTKPPVSLSGPPEAIAKVLQIEPAKRTPQDQQTLANFYRAGNAELALLQQAVAAVSPVPTKRQLGVQDLAWALINSKEFLFNH